ncbi:LamG domain-containing protein, partial [Candidatus Woesearchaeota archaeon]|nr:LamG domain-containing protein [Candidatus Woesearchaeota archaeon]
MFVSGTGTAANLTAFNLSGHFASQVFDSVNTNANWTNITIVTEAPYGIEIGRAINDSNTVSSEKVNISGFINTSGLVLLMHFNNESAFGENATGNSADRVYDFSVDVNSERAGGIHNNGTTVNGATINKSNYKFGSGAGEFDGTDNYVTVPDSNSLDLVTPSTLMVWVYPRNDPSGYVIAKTDFANTGAYSLYWWGDGDKINVYYGSSGVATSNGVFTESDQWVHVAVVFTSSGTSFYRNGRFDSTDGTLTTISQNNQPVTLGIRSDLAAGNRFNGLIDEVSIWNRSLSANEIRNLYLRGTYRLNLSARTCDDSACVGETFTQIINGSGSNTLNGSKMPMDLTKNRYFQYNITYSNESTYYEVKLNVNNVSIEFVNASAAGDTTAPIVNTTFNVTNAIVTDVVNYTANITDETGLLSANWTVNLSTGTIKANYTLSSTSAQVSNFTSLSSCTETCVLNFTIYATDTSNNVKQNSTLLVVADVTLPIVNTTFNISSPLVDSVVNFSGNITDGVGLLSANITYNMSGSVTKANYTISGTSASIHNITAITGCVETCVINFTMYATDVNNNVKQNSTLLVVAYVTAPIVNTTFNTTSPRNIDVINFTGNVTDGNGLLSANWTINFSTGKVYMNYTLSGTTAQVSNKTDLTGLAGGTVLNFTLYATDTNNNVKQNSTVFTIADALAPVVNTTFNISSPLINDVINFTGNVTDETGLLSANITYNISGSITKVNFSLSGTTAQVSNVTKITTGRDSVINFTMYATDTSNNVKQNSTLIVVANTPPTISIVFPSQNLYTSVQPLALNITADDADNDVLNISYYINGVLNQTSLTNTTLNASDGYYVLNVSVSDGIASSPNATVNFTLDTTLPNITLLSPLNNTGNIDGNITFFFNVSDTNSIANCTFIVNNIFNLSNSSITRNISQNFTLTNIGVGAYNWSINCTDQANNTANSRFRNIVVALAAKFNGTTINFTAIDIRNITNLSLEITTAGKINFTQAIDLSQGADLDKYVNISSNRIEVNSTALPALNKSAILYLYGLTFTNPRILRDGAVCSSDICTKISYSGGNLTFNVTNFTVYSSEETPVVEVAPSPSAETGGGTSGGGGGPAIILIPNPGFGIDKAVLKATLLTDETIGETITVENTGNVELNFKVTAEKVDNLLIIN